MEIRDRIRRMIKNQKNKGKDKLDKNTNFDAETKKGNFSVESKKGIAEESFTKNEQHKINKEDVNSKSEAAMDEFSKKFQRFALDQKARQQKQKEKDKRLERQKEKEKMKNQRVYGVIVMVITATWVIFVGFVVWHTSKTLAKQNGILDTWILNALIVSPIGMLLVFLRIVFPSEKSKEMKKGIGARRRRYNK